MGPPILLLLLLLLFDKVLVPPTVFFPTKRVKVAIMSISMIVRAEKLSARDGGVREESARM